MKDVLKDAIVGNKPLWVLTVFAILFLMGGFFCPPIGIIDNSVLKAVGELLAFGALWALIQAIEKGHSATVSHGSTSISITNDSKE